MSADELVPNCVFCRSYFEENGHVLVGACASVGIEQGKSTWRVVADHMAVKHREHSAVMS
jgi:hypothetical protein